ncbi:MAG: DUF2461 domain-containing protein [Alistipes sp.]
MEDIIRFLEQLRRHNNREWFEANKLWYRDVKARFDGLVARLIDAIAAFDRGRWAAVKDRTIGFTGIRGSVRTKNPTNPFRGLFLSSREKSGYAGYYFHVEPQGDGLIGGHLLSAGLYMPEPNVLKSVRDEIFDNGERFAAAVRGASGFSLNAENRLKRAPAGFPSDSPYVEYLKLKDVYLEKFVDDRFMLQADLVESVAREFRATMPFIALLNRAVDYAREEM